VCGLGATQLPLGYDPDALYNEAYFQGGAEDGYADYLGSESVLRNEFRRVLDHIARHGKRRGRLLEFGSAYGFFLAEASRDFECVGVDVSEPALRSCRARGLKAYHPSDSRWMTSGPYDVLVMLDCIEHLENPEPVLDSLARVANADAILVLTTGDWASMYARASGSHWRLMTPPQHLYFYSAHTLRRLLGRFGFNVVDTSHPWKVVPLGLMVYQFASRLGLPIPRFSPLNRVGLPVNLFDAIRVVAARQAP
jgi:SAM-dependent methyltransferase